MRRLSSTVNYRPETARHRLHRIFPQPDPAHITCDSLMTRWPIGEGYRTHLLPRPVSPRARVSASAMHYGPEGHCSVVLMSIQPHVPYPDCLIDDGATLIFDRHEEPMRAALPFLQLCRRNGDAEYPPVCYHVEKSENKQR
jgi:hypothetical protein